MKVRAKMPKGGEEMHGVGYYEHRLFRGGEVFVLSDPSHFSSRWMEKIDDDRPMPEVQDDEGEQRPVKKGSAGQKR